MALVAVAAAAYLCPRLNYKTVIGYTAPRAHRVTLVHARTHNGWCVRIEPSADGHFSRMNWMDIQQSSLRAARRN